MWKSRNIKFFWKKILKTPGGCWLWQGKKSHGYGMCMVNYKYVRAHRRSYELVNGPIPLGMQLHHTCAVRRCVNPEHLVLTTNMEHPGNICAANKRKTYCPKGHEYSPGNTYTYPNMKKRRCRKCFALHSAAFYRKFGLRKGSRNPTAKVEESRT